MSNTREVHNDIETVKKNLNDGTGVLATGSKNLHLERATQTMGSLMARLGAPVSADDDRHIPAYVSNLDKANAEANAGLRTAQTALDKALHAEGMINGGIDSIAGSGGMSAYAVERLSAFQNEAL